MNKPELTLLLKKEAIRLATLQQILDRKKPHFLFLNPLIGNTNATMVDLTIYLEGKNPYYPKFEEGFFNNRQAAMHRNFFTDLHICVEDGLIELIKEKGWEVTSSKRAQLSSLLDKILKKCESLKESPELDELSSLISPHATFNDHLNCVLDHSPSLSKKYKAAMRCYFDGLNIIRNKVSHSDMSLSDIECEKLEKAKLGKALSSDKKLQMTFLGYQLLIKDVIRFFDTLYSHL